MCCKTGKVLAPCLWCIDTSYFFLVLLLEAAAPESRVSGAAQGRNVVIEQAYGGPKITKDGVTVAKAIEFKDHFQNVGAALVKQVASATNDVAGDGAPKAKHLRSWGRQRAILQAHTWELRRADMQGA